MDHLWESLIAQQLLEGAFEVACIVGNKSKGDIINPEFLLGNMTQGRKMYPGFHHEIQELSLLFSCDTHNNTALGLPEKKRIPTDLSRRSHIKSQTFWQCTLHQCHKETSKGDIMCRGYQALADHI
jgi:hypothetical protein